MSAAQNVLPIEAAKRPRAARPAGRTKPLVGLWRVLRWRQAPPSQLPLLLEDRLPLLEWRPPARIYRLPVKPASPCTACPQRSGCRAPCAELEAAVGIPEEIDSGSERPRANITQIAHRRHEAFGEHEPAPDDGEAEPGPLPRWAELLEQRPRLLKAAISKLTVKQQLTVRLLLFDGLSQHEIAQRRGVTDESVSICLRRARARMAEAFAAALKRRQH